MIDLQKICDESYKELKKLGIPVNKAPISTANYSVVAARCFQYPDHHEIKISKKLVETENYYLIKSTIVHELLHTCRDTHNHDKKWQEYVKIAEDAGHYGLYEDFDNDLYFHPEKPIVEEYVCERCHTHYAARKHKENVKCTWCHKPMKKIEIL